MNARGPSAVAIVGAAGTFLAAAGLHGSAPEAIKLTAAAGGAAIGAGALGGLLLHSARHRSITLQNVLVALTPIGAVAAGAMATAHMMMVSSRPIAALGVVLTSSGTVGVLISLMLGARLRLGSEHLITAARQIGDGNLHISLGTPVSEELARLARELESMQFRLAQSRNRERELEASRRQLVSWISHDLRTPLARIRLIVEALQDEIVSDPREVSEHHSRLRAEAERLSSLINDLFELNRINAGELHLERERVPLADVISGLVSSFAVVAEARAVTLRARIPATAIDAEISAPHLERALANLIDNAIRYTDGGGTVEVGLVARDQTAAIVIQDACGGTELAKLEELLHEPTPPHVDGAGRTGLGLAIAKGLVEAHGGRITVERSGGGCRFTVEIPRARGLPMGERSEPAFAEDTVHSRW